MCASTTTSRGTDVTTGLSQGLDLVDVRRFREKLGDLRFLERIFTDSEIGESFRCRAPERGLSIRFAAKEAFLKALGTGLSGIALKEIEVAGGDRGSYTLKTRSKASALLGKRNVFLSASSTNDIAIAFVLIEEIRA